MGLLRKTTYLLKRLLQWLRPAHPALQQEHQQNPRLVRGRSSAVTAPASTSVFPRLPSQSGTTWPVRARYATTTGTPFASPP